MHYTENSVFALYNGTLEQVKKLVSTLNEAEVPSEDVVGKYAVDKAPWNLDCKFMLIIRLKI